MIKRFFKTLLWFMYLLIDVLLALINTLLNKPPFAFEEKLFDWFVKQTLDDVE